MTASDFDTHRDNYAFFHSIETRWIDNDVYGHINNTVYYTYFDTVCNTYLIKSDVLDIAKSPVVGFIVASSCQYLSPVKFPMRIDAGMRVNRIGNRSVEYGVGIFVSDQQAASAYGTFTHVFVNRSSGKSVEIPGTIRQALEKVFKKP